VSGAVSLKHIDKAISQERILEAFLAQETVTNPKEYVLAAVSQPRKWLPLFYFTNQAGLTPAAMIDEVMTLPRKRRKRKRSSNACQARKRRTPLRRRKRPIAWRSMSSRGRLRCPQS